MARWWWWWWCRGARSVARRVLCAALDAALRVLCVVPVVVPHARFAGPDAAPCQTSRYPFAALWAWRALWWLGLQPATPSELKTKRSLQMQPRIQGKRVRCDLAAHCRVICYYLPRLDYLALLKRRPGLFGFESLSWSADFRILAKFSTSATLKSISLETVRVGLYSCGASSVQA